MNLTVPLPKTVTVSGKPVAIRTDFRSWLRFDAALTDNALSFGARIAAALSAVLLEKTIPKDLGALMQALLSFYACEKKPKKEQGSGGSALSFAHDGDLIYAAVLAQYGVDLTRKNPHWYTFCAMLSGLSADAVLSKVILYRSVNLSDIKSKEQKRFYRKMKARYKLPEHRTETRIEQDTAAALSVLI